MALQFFESFESACEQLCEFPELGSVREFSRKELTAVRMWPLPGFERFLLFYRILPESIEIVRVVHGARDLPALFR
jgi:toxin ParE1/3/4